jgi:SAM-dependent methyltransferase
MKELSQQIKYWDSVAGKKRFTHPLNTESFKRLVPKTASILDIGCGYGRICHELNGLGYNNVIGVDISDKMIREGINRYPHLDLRQLVSKDMPFKDDSFDVVIAFAVLTCIPTDKGQRGLINSVLRVLKPNGLFHASDYFLQDDQRNIARYDTYHKKHHVYGLFELEDGAVLRHHSRPWIDTLLSPFHQMLLYEMKAPTMNGHQSIIFQYWGQKQHAGFE